MRPVHARGGECLPPSGCTSAAPPALQAEHLVAACWHIALQSVQRCSDTLSGATRLPALLALQRTSEFAELPDGMLLLALHATSK